VARFTSFEFALNGFSCTIETILGFAAAPTPLPPLIVIVGGS